MAATSRNSGAPIMLLCAIGLGITAVARVWFSSFGVSAGLWGIEAGGQGVRWDNVPGVDFDLILAGYTATVSGLVAAVLCGVIAITSMGSHPVDATRAARFSTHLALAAIAWFVIRFLMDGKLGVDWGLFVGVASVVVLAAMLRRR
jgi:hypothetical protein